MSNPGNIRGNGLADTPEEEMLLIHIAMVALTVIVGAAGLIWLKGAAWLVQHNVLVAAAKSPLLVLPNSGGAGLDLPRIALVVGAVIAGLVCAVSAVRRAWSRGEDQP